MTATVVRRSYTTTATTPFRFATPVYGNNMQVGVEGLSSIQEEPSTTNVT